VLGVLRHAVKEIPEAGEDRDALRLALRRRHDKDRSNYDELAEAFRIVKPGGRVIILDLLKHHFEEARVLYADVWLGFSEVELRRMLGDAGFQNISTALVHREAEAPHFETILAAADK
jgi:ubiquinone/menaquinone biosynthesis C-methylase UbiE